MQVADTPRIDADESATGELIVQPDIRFPRPPLTANDAQSMIERLRSNPRFHTLTINGYNLYDVTALNIIRNGLPLCTAVTTVNLRYAKSGNEGLERLLPAFYNKSVTSLDIGINGIHGKSGGEVIRDLLFGNNTLLDLNLYGNPIRPVGAIGIGQGIAGNYRLQKLDLSYCNIGNGGLANLVMSMGKTVNNSLTDLALCMNNTNGAEGGRLVSLLLQRFPALKVLNLNNNHLGPDGARALAPCFTAPNLVLESLFIRNCYFGNDGIANLIPDGMVNRSLTVLALTHSSQDLVGGENVLSLASRCTNLDRLDDIDFNPDQRHHLNLLLNRKRLCTEASSLGGSPPAVVFEKLLQANSHEHGPSALFVILRDYIFAEQHKSCSSCKRKIQATGVKRKR